MRILLCNWVPFDDREGRGGGIRIYQRNLVNQLLADGHTVGTFSSGLEHDRFDQSIRVEEHGNETHGAARSWRMVNSPVLAPGHHCFGTDQLFEDGPALRTWHEFLTATGPWDVVQFDSLEGVPFTFLRVHEVAPATRVILYAHNYYSVCPQVNLWKNERTACEDYGEGRDCVNCLPAPVDEGEVLRAHQLSRLLRTAGASPGTMAYRASYSVYARLQRHQQLGRAAVHTLTGSISGARRVYEAIRPSASDEPAGADAIDEPNRDNEPPDTRPGGSDESPGPGDARRIKLPLSGATPLHRSDLFRERRVRGTALINAEVDTVVATSHRTAEVLTARGIDGNILRVVYIGSEQAADRSDLRRMELDEPGIVTVAYMGYVRRDKGFHQLVSALARASDKDLAKIRLVVAVGASNDKVFDRLRRLANRMAGVWHHDGYTHDDLPRILGSVDMGIVPVQWEDNLPQVAIEMVSHGVPILTSDRGGAQEVGGNNAKWVFPAEDGEALVQRLVAIADGEIPLSSYWDHVREPVGMDGHLENLSTVWQGTDA